MSMNVFLIIFAIIELFGFAALIVAVCAFIKKLKFEREKLNDNLIRNLGLFFDGLKMRDEKQKIIVAEISKQNDILREQYEALDEAYEHMNARYMEICEHYSKLLTCWAGVEERYSDCYEQLKYQNERFDKIEKFIDDWNQNVWHPEEDIDMDISSLVGEERCKYKCAGRCRNEDCPAFKAYCTIDDPRVCQYSSIIRTFLA